MGFADFYRTLTLILDEAIAHNASQVSKFLGLFALSTFQIHDHSFTAGVFDLLLGRSTKVVCLYGHRMAQRTTAQDSKTIMFTRGQTHGPKRLEIYFGIRRETG